MQLARADFIRLDDPFTYYIVQWFEFLRRNSKDPNLQVWAITSQRAWQICKNLGITNHSQRHWRATQKTGRRHGGIVAYHLKTRELREMSPPVDKER